MNLIEAGLNRSGASLRRTCFTSIVALMLLAASQVSAQTIQSFEDLALRVNLDDQLQVEERSGAKVTGRLTHLTRNELAIQTSDGEKRFTSDTIREVAARGHSLRKAAVVGLSAFAVLGALATCSHQGGGNCIAIGALRAAPVGVGAGLAIGALTFGMTIVYHAPESRASVPGPRPAGSVQPSLLEDLGLRINLDDQLQIEDQSGLRTTGRLTRLTADKITVHAGTGEKHFTRETVRQVAVRQRPLRIAVLIGAGAGTLTGAVAGCAGPTRDECVDAPLLAGALGAGLGLAAGALLHRTTIVFPKAEKRTVILPLISRNAVGVRVSRRW